MPVGLLFEPTDASVPLVLSRSIAISVVLALAACGGKTLDDAPALASSGGIPTAAPNATGVSIPANGPTAGSLVIPKPKNDLDAPIPMPVPDPFAPEDVDGGKKKKKGGTHL